MILCAIGATEIILICAAVLLIFGGKKIPEFMKGLGQGVKQFKIGLNEDQNSSTIEDKYREREKIKENIIKEIEKSQSDSN